MRFARLTLNDLTPWATLLAAAFDRELAQMVQLLQFLGDEEQLAWGAWDGPTLAAQYSCLLREIFLPSQQRCVPVGLSINMAVHPNYRGRGLVKTVSAPVYDVLTDLGAIAGVGFSNAAGVKVDKHSSGYGYSVVGKLRPYLFWLRPHQPAHDFYLSTEWPNLPFLPTDHETAVHFAWTPTSLHHRFACHPFRTYRFGVWQKDGAIAGIVIYRSIQLAGLPGAALLSAYGRDLSNLLSRWTAALADHGVRFVHLAGTPTARTARLMRETAVCLPQFYSHNPYYLTLKPLTNQLPQAAFHLENWSCLGGDVL
ncbi:MAG: GNAT family N-acetyltransferase [Anaerolineales bacterium]|nr:GNAT family N-acetyltransferase [Anaerolineales bacterium]